MIPPGSSTAVNRTGKPESVLTPTFLLEDRYGELHEVSQNDRVLVLGGSERETHDWVRAQGQLPYGRQWVLVPRHGPRLLEGARFDVIVTLPSFDLHPQYSTVLCAVQRIAAKMVRLTLVDG